MGNPKGLYASIAKDMGNLFVCERETPESEKNAPAWKVAGTEPCGGEEAFVIETEGDTAVPLAQERMANGLARSFPGDPALRPKVKVLQVLFKTLDWQNRPPPSADGTEIQGADGDGSSERAATVD